jgi:hypothetical protein
MKVREVEAKSLWSASANLRGKAMTKGLYANIHAKRKRIAAGSVTKRCAKPGD